MVWRQPATEFECFSLFDSRSGAGKMYIQFARRQFLDNEVVVVEDVAGDHEFLKVSLGEKVTVNGFVFEKCVGDNGDTEKMIYAYRRVGAVDVEEGWLKLSVCATPADVSHELAAVMV